MMLSVIGAGTSALAATVIVVFSVKVTRVQEQQLFIVGGPKALALRPKGFVGMAGCREASLLMASP